MMAWMLFGYHNTLEGPGSGYSGIHGIRLRGSHLGRSSRYVVAWECWCVSLVQCPGDGLSIENGGLVGGDSGGLYLGM